MSGGRRTTQSGTFQSPPPIWVTLFPHSLVECIAGLDRLVQPLEPLPDILRSGQRLPRGGMRSDEATENGDHHPDVGYLPVGPPREAPMTLRLRQRVKQVDVLLRKVLPANAAPQSASTQAKQARNQNPQGIEVAWETEISTIST